MTSINSRKDVPIRFSFWSVQSVLASSLVGLVLIAHTTLLAWSGLRHTPVASELAHLAAGLSHWELARFDLLPVNPPFVRTVASFPVWIGDPVWDWSSYSDDPIARAEHPVGRDFFNANGIRTLSWLTFARWMCIPFSVLGALVCYCWAKSLSGLLGGLLALVLWCFSPFVLGHASLMICDAHASAIAITATYAFRFFLISPNWRLTLLSGGLLGLALLSKLTFLVLLPLWFLAWLIVRWTDNDKDVIKRDTFKVPILFGISIFIVNLGYGFDNSFRPLGTFHFHSRALSGMQQPEKAIAVGGNRFYDSWMGIVPVPFPEKFVVGIDKQKSDFDRDQLSFLRGKWKIGGWPEYYVYGLTIKMPIGTLVLTGVGMAVALFSRSLSLPDKVLLLLTPVAVLGLVSAHTGFSHHMRYAFPALPYAYVMCGTATLTRCRWPWANKMVVLLAISSIVSSLFSYPHCYSYFNESCGGPRKRSAYLSESNIAWGQDLAYLARWLRRNPSIERIGVKHKAFFDIRKLEIDPGHVPVGVHGLDAHCFEPNELGPLPGWYAINVTYLHGNSKNYWYFRRFSPVARVGGSFEVFHISIGDANRVRREQGLPLLEDGAARFPIRTRKRD